MASGVDAVAAGGEEVVGAVKAPATNGVEVAAVAVAAPAAAAAFIACCAARRHGAASAAAGAYVARCVAEHHTVGFQPVRGSGLWAAIIVVALVCFCGGRVGGALQAARCADADGAGRPGQPCDGNEDARAAIMDAGTAGCRNDPEARDDSSVAATARAAVATVV